MPVDVRLDGDVIATIDEQVLSVGVQTARGTVMSAGLAADDGVIDLIVERVAPGGPPRLDQIEAAQLQALRDRAEEGQVVGYGPASVPVPVRAGQGFHDETLREGGVDKEASKRTIHKAPTRDLASGLDPSDTDALNARLTAFSDHGDADRAIKENKATKGEQTAEKGATPEDSRPSDSSSTSVQRDEGSSSTSGGDTGDGGKLPASTGEKGSQSTKQMTGDNAATGQTGTKPITLDKGKSKS